MKPNQADIGTRRRRRAVPWKHSYLLIILNVVSNAQGSGSRDAIHDEQPCRFCAAMCGENLRYMSTAPCQSVSRC